MIGWISKKRNKKGFTLIELIVVIAILGILAAIAIPRFTNIQKNARIDADITTAETIVNAAKLYIASNNLTNEKAKDTGAITVEQLIEDGLLESNASKIEGEEDAQTTTKQIIAQTNEEAMEIVVGEDDDELTFTVSAGSTNVLLPAATGVFEKK